MLNLYIVQPKKISILYPIFYDPLFAWASHTCYQSIRNQGH